MERCEPRLTRYYQDICPGSRGRYYDKVYCIRLGLMHVVVVDWLSVKETVADELDKQLRIEENHDCS